MMRATLRTIALFVGLLGTLIALVVNILYSLTHTLAKISGFTDDQSHFFLGLIVAFVAFVGQVLVVRLAVPGAALLLIAGIAFFFIVSWWAIFASIFLFGAVALAFLARNERRSAVPSPYRQQQYGHSQRTITKDPYYVFEKG